jgi:hypothetical protein
MKVREVQSLPVPGLHPGVGHHLAILRTFTGDG